MIEEMTIIKNYHHFFLNNQSTVFRLFQQTLFRGSLNAVGFQQWLNQHLLPSLKNPSVLLHG